MKNLKILSIIGFFALTIFLITACEKKDNNKETPDGDCFVQLFEGDNYTDDHFTIKEPGEYPDLTNLPGADKNWDDEADSFKSGKNTTVIFWSEKNFGGDSVIYHNGAQAPSIDEPRSMKITCQ